MNKLLRLRSFRKHRPDLEALSAHLDGQLDAARALVLDAHVSACSTCRELLEGMRTNRALLQSMPAFETPRSFRLRVADVEAPAAVRASAPSRGSTPSPMRWAPMLGGAAAVIFVVVLGADIVTRSNSSDSQFTVSAPERNGAIAADESSSKTGVGGAAGGSVIRPPDTGTSIPGASQADGAEATTGDAQFDTATTVPAKELAQGAPVPAESAQSAYSAEDGAEGQPTDANPTGAAPDGDVPAPGVSLTDPSIGTDASGMGVERTPGDAATAATSAVPALGATAPAGVILPDTVPVATNTPAEVAAFSGENVPKDGNRRGLRIVEITAAAIAAVASAVFVAWRWRRRGDAS